MPSRDTNVGAKRARETRAALGLDPGAALGCVLTTVERDAGLPVLVARLDDGVAGCCVRSAAAAVAVRQRRRRAGAPPVHARARVRPRAAAATTGATSVDSAEVLAGRTRDPREVQANAFAAEFLAPRAGVDGDARRRARTSRRWSRIAARFGLSTLAALNRLGTLGRTRRYDRLRAEIDAGDHRHVWAYLAPAEVRRRARAGSTRCRGLSPALAGSELAAMLRGDAPAAPGRRRCAAASP